MNALISQALAALAIALLRYFQQREDLKASIRLELEKEAMAYAIRATEWRARAAGYPYAVRLGVRNVKLSISIQSDVADAGSGAEGVSVPSQG
jgi:hypothetical protein